MYIVTLFTHYIFKLKFQRLMKNSHVQGALKVLIDNAPALLLGAMIVSFLLSSTVQYFYYTDYVFKNFASPGTTIFMGICVSFLVQAVRFALGVTGAFVFSEGKFWNGMFGVFLSVAVTIWTSFEATHIAAWAGTLHPTDMVKVEAATHFILQFVVWVGLLLEIRLALAVTPQKESTQEEDSQEPEREVLPDNLPKAVTEKLPGTNGTTRTFNLNVANSGK